MMSIVRYRQWPTQSEIRNLLGPLLETPATSLQGWAPAVDIREEPTQFVLLADLPGVEPSSIEVQMDKGVLEIRGERRAPAAAGEGRFSRSERRHGAFNRRFALPDSANAEGIAARSQNGVLEIRIPKREEPAPRRIQVQVASPAV
jgi:HSP20 family protein